MRRALFWLFPALLASCAAGRPDSTGRPLASIPLSDAFWREEYAGDAFYPLHPAQPLWLASPGFNHLAPTRAALLVTREEFPAYGFEVEVEFALVEQFRLKPNPWETFWLFFNFQSTGPRTKATNYVLLKPNGIELGRAFGEVGQAFLFTGESPRLQGEKWMRLRLKVESRKVTVFVDGRKAAEVPASGFFRQPGRIGLYVEDAKVAVRSVKVGN